MAEGGGARIKAENEAKEKAEAEEKAKEKAKKKEAGEDSDEDSDAAEGEEKNEETKKKADAAEEKDSEANGGPTAKKEAQAAASKKQKEVEQRAVVTLNETLLKESAMKSAAWVERLEARILRTEARVKATEAKLEQQELEQLAGEDGLRSTTSELAAVEKVLEESKVLNDLLLARVVTAEKQTTEAALALPSAVANALQGAQETERNQRLTCCQVGMPG